jgi:hypothetical protein
MVSVLPSLYGVGVGGYRVSDLCDDTRSSDLCRVTHVYIWSSLPKTPKAASPLWSTSGDFLTCNLTAFAAQTTNQHIRPNIWHSITKRSELMSRLMMLKSRKNHSGKRNSRFQTGPLVGYSSSKKFYLAWSLLRKWHELNPAVKSGIPCGASSVEPINLR